MREWILRTQATLEATVSGVWWETSLPNQDNKEMNNIFSRSKRPLWTSISFLCFYLYFYTLFYIFFIYFFQPEQVATVTQHLSLGDWFILLQVHKHKWVLVNFIEKLTNFEVIITYKRYGLISSRSGKTSTRGSTWILLPLLQNRFSPSWPTDSGRGRRCLRMSRKSYDVQISNKFWFWNTQLIWIQLTRVDQQTQAQAGGVHWCVGHQTKCFKALSYIFWFQLNLFWSFSVCLELQKVPI